MILFGGNDPTTFRIGSDNDLQGNVLYFAQVPVNFRVQSSAHALLLNEAGRLVYGGLVMEWALNAYAKSYGGAVIEYILGGIVEADFVSVIDITSIAVGERESNATFTSVIDITSLVTGEVEVDASFDSVLDITSLFPAERTSNAEFLSVIEFVGEWLPDAPGIDAWAFTLGGEAAPASRYENFDFNSFAALEGHYYAVGDDGIFELGGEDDDGVGIAGHILTGSRPQGVDRLQRMPILYLTGRSTGVLHCSVVDEEGVAHDYTAERPLGARESRQRVKIGKGLKASLWQLRIGNEAGQDFELMDAGSLPDVQKRRVG